MRVEIKSFIEGIFNFYMKEENKSVLLSAKESYFELTGKPNDDSDDYEMRMNLFNDWFVFNYKLGDHTLWSKHLDLIPDPNMKIESVYYSLFEYNGKSLLGKESVQDLFLKSKFILDKEGMQPHLMKEDFFIGRVVTISEKNYLLEGLRLLPKETKSLLKKKLKPLIKAKDTQGLELFLLELENKTNRWMSYRHIEAKKFFST